MIRLAFRLDDPSELSDQAVEAGVIEALREHGACATLAVIPFRERKGEVFSLSSLRAKPLINAMREGIIEIAQHGYLHKRREAAPAPPTEFVGCPRSEQMSMIRRGRDHLESIFGCCIQGFCPPFNSYDHGTLAALDALGFTYLSAGQKHVPHAFPLKSIPLTAHLKDFPALLNDVEPFRLANPVVVFVMHHYDFAESGEPDPMTDLTGFRDMLHRLRTHPDIQISTLGQIAATLPTGTAHLSHCQKLARYRFLNKTVPRHAFLGGPVWKAALSRLVYG